MAEPNRYFYTDTSSAPVGPGSKVGFVAAMFKGWAIAPNGKKFWFYVYGLSTNFSAEFGDGVKAALEQQYRYKVKKIEKLLDTKIGKKALPDNSRLLNYIAYADY